jgi:DNA helicase-2/ATP-dependent DNA helicase PcrA
MKYSNLNYLKNLNENQRKSVIDLDGPCLIVAGAGSGKTRVLTTRVVHIIKERKAWPNQILCVTFTNKAAKEMQVRVSKLLYKQTTAIPWLGTFHSISAKILRKHAAVVNLNSNFTIIDRDDQLRLIKNICKAENINIKKLSPQFVIVTIDKWKNKGLYPKNVVTKKKDNIWEKEILNIYKIYQEKILALNACDFGDLILHCVSIFENEQGILDIYSKNFKYILVDEYQDTNFIQSKWLNLLAKQHNNICCVGDDDQSIYSWRGAEIKNFLNFDQLYKNLKKIKLEQNYRSTQNILSTASELISKNQGRIGKNLWTKGEEGEFVKLNCYKNGKDEAINISDIIEKKLKKKFSYNNIAILVRAIFQTREFEERFLKIGIRYRIVGGTKFYERSEIKDSVAYLRIIFQKKDDLAFERIVNTPKRSIGDTTMRQINEYARKHGLCLEDASLKMIEMNKIKPKTKIGLLRILALITKWRKDLSTKKHIEVMQIILDESGYSEMLKNKKDIENEGRLENIKELLRGLREFENLESFLEHVALATSIDEDWKGEKINLMTMHAAKGLEFDVVFLPGWEEGLFPHQKSLEEKGDAALEEERRLAYVGITRAKKQAYISFSMNRFYQGEWIENLASRFVEELPKENIEQNLTTENFIDDFEFNQDISFEEEIKSPGWLRLQKKLNEKK